MRVPNYCLKRYLHQAISIVILCLCLPACNTISVNHSDLSKNEGYVSSQDGAAIYYKRLGTENDQTLIFLHCWGCNSSYWEPQIEYFANNYQVVILDFAGHGLSGADREDFTVEKFADDIEAVIRKLDQNNIILVGHSLGAASAIETASRISDHIDGIIAVDTFETSFNWPDQLEIDAVMLPYQKNFYQTTYRRIKSRFVPHTDKSLIYQVAKDIALAPPDIGANSLKNFYQWMAKDFRNIRLELKVPLIHINSLRSKKSTGDNSEQILYVKYAGHFIPQEAPGKFNEALNQALQKFNSQK